MNLPSLWKLNLLSRKSNMSGSEAFTLDKKKKVNDKDVKLVLDGIECEFDPVDADSQHNLRQALIKKLYNSISEKDNWELENYSKARSELKKGFG